MPPVSDLFRFPGAQRHDPAVAAWFQRSEPMRDLAQAWFDKIRGCGDDVRELLHDHMPTACVGDAAFAYVGAFAQHVSIGFFQGASLKDPAGLLEGSGKRMRHVKLRWGQAVDEAAVETLIEAAYRDMKRRAG